MECEFKYIILLCVWNQIGHVIILFCVNAHSHHTNGTTFECTAHIHHWFSLIDQWYVRCCLRHLPLEYLFVDLLMLSSYYICIVLTSHINAYTHPHSNIFIRKHSTHRWMDQDYSTYKLYVYPVSVSFSLHDSQCVNNWRKKFIPSLYLCPINRTFASLN